MVHVRARRPSSATPGALNGMLEPSTDPVAMIVGAKSNTMDSTRNNMADTKTHATAVARQRFTHVLSLPEYVLSLIVLFGGWMVALFGIAGQVRPAGLTGFSITAFAGLSYVVFAWFIYGSNIQVLMWVADLMEDRVLRTRENWKNEPLRSLVEVGSWLHITFRIYAVSESALVAGFCGSVVGAFCVVLGDYFTAYARAAEQRLMAQVARTSYAGRYIRKLSGGEDIVLSDDQPVVVVEATADNAVEKVEEEEDHVELQKEFASVVITPQFFSLLVTFAFALALYHVNDSHDLGLAVILTTMANVAFITSEQVLMLWRPTRWAAVILHDRVLNVVYNWQHETIRSGFETCFYLSSIFSCYMLTESIIISMLMGTVTGIIIILVSSWIGIGLYPSVGDTSTESLVSRSRLGDAELFQCGVFTLAIFSWALVTLMYTIYLRSESSVLALAVVIPTSIAIVCVAEMAVSSTRCYFARARSSIAEVNKKSALKTKWSVFQFTVGALLFADHDEPELPEVRMADVLAPEAQEAAFKENRADLMRRLCFNKTNRIVTREELATDMRGRKLVAVEGYVFDVEDFVVQHPGGEALLLDFAKRHADISDQFAAFHHADVYARLIPMLVGKLKAQGASEEDSLSKAARDQARRMEAAVSEYHKLVAHLWHLGYFEGAESDSNSARSAACKHLVAVSLGIFAVCQVILLSHDVQQQQQQQQQNGGEQSTGFDLHFFVQLAQCTLAGLTMGIFWQQVAFIAHDALHNGVVNRTKERRPHHSLLWPNNVLGWLHASVGFGISSSMWLDEHSVHHALTMRPCQDAQFSYLPIWCVSLKEFSTRFWLDMKGTTPVISAVLSALTKTSVAVQHWTLLPLAVLIGRFNFYVLNIIYALKRGIVYDLVGMSLFWAIYLMLLAQLGDTTLQVCFVLVSHWTCGVLHVQLLINHLATNSFTADEEANIGFFAHQVLTTRNIDSTKAMDWFHGGLQYQIEHHLAPQLPRHRLALVAPAVKDICERNGLVYESVGFLKAISLTLENFKDIADEVWSGNIAT